MTTLDWSDVRERIEHLRRADRRRVVFGADEHTWQLEPPLGPDELADAETQLGVELPAEYRSFVLQVGRGGAGPAYGLFPVRRLAGRWQWDGDGAELTDLDTLDQPFPHVQAFNPADGTPAREDFESDDAWVEAVDAIVYDPKHSIGLLYLCHLGCALRECLVITGPARGQMWADDTTEDKGFRPMYDEDRTPLGFARWYRRWLDAAERQVL
ncbi:SMI1/KNR4 family protein [Kribbella antibiotica]|uniref:SMI1/KNR4 family protein n=1 Tax=Kribbella antibiotica TaxID=190195 RepID=A0A4R4ZTL7_9ACTN|nr:SMI1/KNR4 family protein [Kribbella antibiotica]TDD62185.1 SMI1/KNR4 family protein [Kribbella antibiotica]